MAWYFLANIIDCDVFDIFEVAVENTWRFGYAFEVDNQSVKFYGFLCVKNAKTSWESVVKLMNKTKMKKWEGSVESSNEPVEQSHKSANTNDLELLPALTETVNDTLSDVSSIDDEDNKETIEKDDILVLYEDWINEQDWEDVQMMAMMMYDYFVKQFQLTKMRAAEEFTWCCLEVSDRTVRSQRKIFLSNHRYFEEQRGKYAWFDALDDEEYRDMTLEWVCSNAYVKGKSNMIAANFCAWAGLDLLPKVLDNHLLFWITT